MSIKALLALSVFVFTAPAFGTADKRIQSCKSKIFNAADTIQSIANTVPNRAFGKFTKNGRWLPLAITVTGLGGGNPVVGAQKLFKTAKPTFDKYESRILKAARACVGHCDDIRALKKRCDEVQDLAGLLRNLDFDKGYEIAQAMSSYGGTDGVKRSVVKEINGYNRDRR